MKPKVFIISQEQFGYLTDYYRYVQNLKNDFEITYCCWDYDRPKENIDDAKVVYVNRNGNVVSRNIRFIIRVFQLCHSQTFDLLFINYFRGCSVLNIFAKETPKLLDIRTSCIRPFKINRNIQNLLIYVESLFYKRITIISRGLASLLHISQSKITDLPIGADLVSVSPKIYDQIHLLYVGTLYKRKIEDTIIGFKCFIENNKDVSSTYTIIGKGLGNEENELRNLLFNLKLEKQVFVKGYIKHELLHPYFEKATVGVSYIPITPYYQFQPATKTFEYLFAGLPVIATNTFENAKIINSENGCLIEDNPESFAQGLKYVVNSFNKYDMKSIQESVIKYNWINICNSLKEIIFAELERNANSR
jgi:glycosyltransferase involved in cell wall biosynthesis